MNRRWIPMITAVTAVALPFIGGSPAPVSASCDGEVTTPMIDAADAAGIGTVLGNNDGLWVIDITTDAKGNLPDQVAVEVSDDGDADWSSGRDIAALFYVDDERLTTNECAQPSAATLETWTPPTSRAGEVSYLLGGSWSTYRTVGFDSAGQPVAYGREAGRVIAISPCSDGSTVAELVELEDGAGEVALRSLDDFAVFDTSSTPLSAATQSSGSTSPLGDLSNEELICDGSSADQVEILVGGDNQFSGPGLAPAWEPDAVTGLALAPPVATNPDTSIPEPVELSLAEPPTVGGWSPWLLVLGAAGVVAYVVKKAQDPEWRSSWNKPDNGRNSTGRRREDATGPGHFN